MAEDIKKEAARSVSTEKVNDIILPAAVLAVDVAPDGKIAYAACQDGGVYSVNLEAGKHDLLGRHESYASGAVLLRGARVLVTGGYDGALIWHDLDLRQPIRKVKAHDFWSWDLAASPDGSFVASVTGRYEAGGYKYEPAPGIEPGVKVFDAQSGELRHAFEHVPPVQAVAISPDNKYVAAGNLMGEISVWDILTGKRISHWTTPDLTSWGIIKSHHYLGGVFAMAFGPGGDHLYVCGMGPMRDPMAGNGVQRWQKFSWRDGKQIDQTHEGESGQGLMEALAFHPTQELFAMAGRLFQGKWNLAFFDSGTGSNLHALDAKHRITDAIFTPDGARLVLAKAKGQERKKDGKWSDYGLLEILNVRSA